MSGRWVWDEPFGWGLESRGVEPVEWVLDRSRVLELRSCREFVPEWDEGFEGEDTDLPV